MLAQAFQGCKDAAKQTHLSAGTGVVSWERRWSQLQLAETQYTLMAAGW